MELRPHQQKALDNVNEIFAEDNKAIVVHPTGTGKTYIALELFRQNKDKKMVFVSPSSAIIGQLKVSIAKEFGVKPEEYKKVFPNLEITTYQQINSDFKKSETYAQDFDADLVVFDEAHHTAATEWGKNAKALMNSHPETNFLGLTATPQRPDGIDVVKEVFDGNLADEITLEEAVATRLLKMPNYVTALYSYEPIIEMLEAGIEAMQDKNPEKYLMLKKDMEIAKNMLEKSKGLPEIFAKHMKKKDGKYIVFCKDINHLNKMVEAAKTQGWFDGVNENVEILAIHSEEDDKTNAKVLKRFRDNHVATDNTLRILFSVEKINEGLHLDDIAGEIMLRPTKSKIIYRQQLGRVMAISSKNGRAVVFDIVDNIDSFDDIKDFIDGVRELGGGHLDGEDPFDEFYLADEMREEREALRRIAGELEVEWEEFYQRSVKWREEHENNEPKSSSKDKNERTIYDWERYQKLKYLKEYQDLEEQDIPEAYREKVKKLKVLGLVYTPIETKSQQEKTDVIVAYIKTNGPNAKMRDLEDGTPIGKYVKAIRRAFKNGSLDDENKKKLERVGFKFSEGREQSRTVEEKIELIVSYYKAGGDISNTTKRAENGTNIGLIIKSIRREYKKKQLSPQQIKQLEDIGFVFEQIKADNKTIDEKIDMILAYYKEKGEWPKTQQTVKNGYDLGQYISDIRKLYKLDKLDKEQIKKLEAEGFCFLTRDTSKDKTLQEKIEVVIEYIKKNGPKIEISQQLEDGTTIGQYVGRIRNSKKKLTTEEIKRLDDVGFIWDARKLKPLQQEKEQELTETRQLKKQSEQAETLDAQTQAALDQAIDEQTQKPKGPGE